MITIILNSRQVGLYRSENCFHKGHINVRRDVLRCLNSVHAQVALELWVDWVKKGYASRDVVNWNQGDVANSFNSGHAATMVMGSWMLGEVKRSGIDFGIVWDEIPGDFSGCAHGDSPGAYEPDDSKRGAKGSCSGGKIDFGNKIDS
jgi:hypothetical protein